MTLRLRPQSLLAVLPLLALTSTLRPANAQTIITAPTTTGGTVAAVPAGPQRTGTPVIVAATIDTTGNADNAKQALRFANEALAVVPGYAPLPASDYAPLGEAMAKLGTTTDWGWPLTGSDYQKLGKASKATHALTVQVTPTTGGYAATAEMYETKRGVLTGHSRGIGTGDDALRNAIGDAVQGLGRTAVITGAVISKPGGYNARLSLGTNSGARGGARVEYLDGTGQPIAFGTIYDIGSGESVATVAPESAFSDVFVNQRVRLVTNPVEKRALPSATSEFDKEFSRFENAFVLAAGVAAAVYHIAFK